MPDFDDQVAKLYEKIADKERLPFRFSHAQQPNSSPDHDDDHVLKFGEKHADQFMDRAVRIVNPSRKS